MRLLTEAMLRKSILFISTQWDRWGGSEELWSQTALNLVASGFAVSASVHCNSPLHDRVQALSRGGVEVRPRALRYPIWRLWRRLTAKYEGLLVAEVRRFLETNDPLLVVFSSGGPVAPIELLDLCIAKRVPFVTIGQANTENWWPEDDEAERYRNALLAANRCYFVSKGNMRLFEKQIGCELSNAEIIRNPFQVKFDASPPWPLTENGEVLFACVGRLHPPSKGQDVLLESLAHPSWADRNWRLTLYGEGPMKTSIQRLVQRLRLENRVIFAGHVAVVEDIWWSNQVLVMPSRCEGLPLAMVEAMLCGRPVIATDVGGHSEIIEDGISGFLAEAPTVPSMLKALDRFWACRAEIQDMGKVAAERIRQIIPQNPVTEFTNKIRGFVSTRAM